MRFTLFGWLLLHLRGQVWQEVREDMLPLCFLQGPLTLLYMSYLDHSSQNLYHIIWIGYKASSSTSIGILFLLCMLSIYLLAYC